MMSVRIECDSLAELAAVGAMIRGEVIDDATVAKLQALSQALKIDAAALASALNTGAKQ